MQIIAFLKLYGLLDQYLVTTAYKSTKQHKCTTQSQENEESSFLDLILFMCLLLTMSSLSAQLLLYEKREVAKEKKHLHRVRFRNKFQKVVETCRQPKFKCMKISPDLHTYAHRKAIISMQDDTENSLLCKNMLTKLPDKNRSKIKEHILNCNAASGIQDGQECIITVLQSSLHMININPESYVTINTNCDKQPQHQIREVASLISKSHRNLETFKPLIRQQKDDICTFITCLISIITYVLAFFQATFI